MVAIEKGTDHLIKTITYPISDIEGNAFLENVCIDIDACGKTDQEKADGISLSLKRFERYCTAKLISITGDPGGRGAMQVIFGKLVAMGNVFLSEAIAK